MDVGQVVGLLFATRVNLRGRTKKARDLTVSVPAGKPRDLVSVGREFV